MSFPGINIEFINGQLGQTVATPDGICLFAVSAVATEKFELNKAYEIRSMIDVAQLGILPDVDNYRLYKTLREFYNQAGEGVKCWIMGFDKSTKVSDWFTADVLTGIIPIQSALDTAKGEISLIGCALSPDAEYVPVITKAIDSDIVLAMQKAETFLNTYTKVKYAPASVVFEGYAFTGNKTELDDLGTMNFERCSVMLGDTEPRTGSPASNGACIGTYLGRLSVSDVQVNPGRVRDGALKISKAFIGDVPVEQYDTEALHDKGYVTLRTHTGKSGYFFADCPTASSATSDYHYLTHRRVIDKAYRLAYQGSLDFLLDDNEVMPNGAINPIYAKAFENAIESLIFQEMTANGELSQDTSNPKDRGVICRVDLQHNVVSTGELKIAKLQVRAKGYNRYIDIPLGFVPVTINNE
ncbi:hypothetical protein HX004_14040 [Myroides sp. 1354]|uniref:DUF2586 family protein n=1 Tax=unclassified Myroides TaxID=2642485 RepID=UPI002575EACB|nr:MULTISPECIES: DUF2586 family protein [unclassified Myroides]MDM1045875.1 hypothetical protein [Myroides sp. R163-1]MDM1056885.1 hypothetical protein [Myroides sp. 1354]MDM1070080.1 hypothetical protein [Myroides sp. 1372]